MADTPIRTQLKPAASTRERLYTAGADVVLSSIVACNLLGVRETVRISLSIEGEAESLKQHLCYDLPIPPGLPYVLTGGVTMRADDVLWVWSSCGGVAFSAFGMETT